MPRTFSDDGPKNPKFLAWKHFSAKADEGTEVSLAGHNNPTFANRYLIFWMHLHVIADNHIDADGRDEGDFSGRLSLMILTSPRPVEPAHMALLREAFSFTPGFGQVNPTREYQERSQQFGAASWTTSPKGR